MITTLSIEQYRATMIGRMINVTESAEPDTNIWPYVELLVKKEIISKYVFDNQLVEIVYRNQVGTFDHVLLPTADSKTFIVIVVDLTKREIFGHFILNLKEQYGL